MSGSARPHMATERRQGGWEAEATVDTTDRTEMPKRPWLQRAGSIWIASIAPCPSRARFRTPSPFVPGENGIACFACAAAFAWRQKPSGVWLGRMWEATRAQGFRPSTDCRDCCPARERCSAGPILLASWETHGCEAGQRSASGARNLERLSGEARPPSPAKTGGYRRGPRC